jgi:signal transduction histidine kinase
VAHETRNPIVTIGGFARRMLREVPPDKPFFTYLELIIKEVERLELMIFWIAEFKKYISVNLEPTNINTVIERALAEVRHLIKGREIKIEKDLLPDPPLVRVDCKNMSFVFSNLFENAIEAMNRHGVLRISCRVEEDDRLEVDVADNGKGIAPEYLKDIFNPFFTSKMAGAGMGLTIAYKIVSDHNGAIRVRSSQGKGTTCTVEIPLLGGSRDLQAL